MNLWDRVTGKDMTKELKAFNMRAQKLPTDFQETWEKISLNLWSYSDFTGRNLMPILDGVIAMLEAAEASGQSAKEVIGDDINGFCTTLAAAEGAESYRDRLREQLNNNITQKLGKLEGEMSIHDIIEGKKEWRAHIARVKRLPKDYQIVYKEIQKYIFKVDTVEMTERINLLIEIVEFFEEGASSGKTVLEITGSDVGDFCDDLLDRVSKKECK